MTELKTLKDLGSDIEIGREEQTNPDGSIMRIWEVILKGYVSKDKLKAEAVKWVKEFESRKDFLNPTLLNWIVKFFNLTSEDLKNDLTAKDIGNGEIGEDLKWVWVRKE